VPAFCVSFPVKPDEIRDPELERALPCDLFQRAPVLVADYQGPFLPAALRHEKTATNSSSK